ncbi:hypothetical protein RJT34_04372 [Clitoria ternatea]|uniref:RRM domain-containing protein n=1 Tax=Clitoria ternatea TaxID=43366 RepID=A0AAN9KLW3_CLITE
MLQFQSRSLFVKNLNFKTTDESLREHFGKCIKEQLKEGAILSAKVMGLNGDEAFEKWEKCFHGVWIVEFDFADLYRHMLGLELRHIKNKGQVQKTVEKDRSSTKLFVGNVACEETKKELEETFGVFGEYAVGT